MKNVKKKSKRKKIILLVSIPIIILLFVAFVINTGKNTIDIKVDTIVEKIDTYGFIIQEEDIVNFNNINNVDIKVKEGVKISMDTVVASSNSQKFTNQEVMNFDIISKKVEDEKSQNNNIFKNDLDKLDFKIGMLHIEIENAKNHKDKRKLMEEKKDLEDKRKTIEGAFRYAFSDNESLSEIRDEMIKDSTVVQGQITPKNLGLNYGGYVFFQKDGLENLLHKDLLGKITAKYYNEIDTYIQKEQSKEQKQSNHQVIKFVDDTKMYMIVKVPKNSFKKEEETLLEMKEDIDSKWREEGQPNFYSYIEIRRDILKRFPKMSIEYKNNTIDGYLLDVNNRDSAEDNKILTIKINTQNHSLIGQRQLDVSLITKKHSGYILPKKAIVVKDGKEGVFILNKSDKKYFIEVNIKSRLEDKVILDPRENQGIKPTDKIFI